MKEILKILKKHLPKIGFIIVFLVLLANCDLALPSYTSNIVNVGIQQNGIEYATPIVMREETYNELRMFMGDKQDILDNYTKISKSNLESKKYNEYISNLFHFLKHLQTIKYCFTINIWTKEYNDKIKNAFNEAFLKIDIAYTKRTI